MRCAGQGPVVSGARPGGVVVAAHLGRVLQKEVANGFLDAALVTVSGIMAAPELQLRVEAAVSLSEPVDGDFIPSVGVGELPSQADGRIHGSVVRSGVGGCPPRLPFPEEVMVDGMS